MLKKSAGREGVAWLVPCAHGTPTIKQWSFDVRSWEPIQATPRKKVTSELGRNLVAREVLAQSMRAVERRAQALLENLNTKLFMGIHEAKRHVIAVETPLGAHKIFAFGYNERDSRYVAGRHVTENAAGGTFQQPITGRGWRLEEW